ncbi:CCA tRNA nucleotidyltransferase [Chondromyces apiculatus]|uniref:tRNA nucleotidyltransferase n=1 Tax=Chondromyces apiculatus DSM 436 TaxID=1192034 RepID=A0A017T545_9BACT|nr:HD domain-containing protein [Chondromyces apiculatus]EYF03935.1 tRNA nucleotidyltransferase [Chondromyces apiculatus DSM 436]
MSDLARLIDLVPRDVLGICQRLREQGKRGWIVGGCVRDLLRGKPAKDWDVCTDARPEETMRFFRKVIPTGIQHGTVTVVVKGVHYEVTTLRGEGAYTDGRRPDSVEFVDDITADLARRDFTFNAIAIDPVDGHLIDPFDGRADLEARTLRAVGNADERFAEDGLRVLRGARFAATLECSIAPDTERAMGSTRSLETFRRVSQERVRDEWLKAMGAPRPSVAFEAMRRTGILGITCPELVESVGCGQNRYHAYDVWGHAMACLDACRPEPILRVAALLHDVGKPRTRAFSEKTQDYTFYDHERVGAEIADPFLMRMRFSNEERARIVALVRHHLICYSDDWSDAAVRRWLRRVTPALAPQLYDLGEADALGKGRDAEDDVASIARLRARAEALIQAGAAMSTRDLALNGGALMKGLGIAPGPIVGKILERLVEVVTDDPSANTPERLLDAARQMVAESGQG